jgi:Flp pilus assembly pilin Flp
MKVFVNHCVRDRSGAPATEYRLIAARIFAEIVAVVAGFRISPHIAFPTARTALT